MGRQAEQVICDPVSQLDFSREFKISLTILLALLEFIRFSRLKVNPLKIYSLLEGMMRVDIQKMEK